MVDFDVDTETGNELIVTNLMSDQGWFGVIFFSDDKSRDVTIRKALLGAGTHAIFNPAGQEGVPVHRGVIVLSPANRPLEVATGFVFDFSRVNEHISISLVECPINEIQAQKPQ